MELRVARVMFAEYLLFEIQRDVNILLYIEPERQSEKVFLGKMREASLPSFFRNLPSILGACLGKERGERMPKDGEAVIT